VPSSIEEQLAANAALAEQNARNFAEMDRAYMAGTYEQWFDTYADEQIQGFIDKQQGKE